MCAEKNTTKQNGYIALMAAIIISLSLLVMAVEEGMVGWHVRFSVLGTEAKEQSHALAEGCAQQAAALFMTDPTYIGNATSTITIQQGQQSTCHVFPLVFNTPSSGFVTVTTQAQVRGSYSNLVTVFNVHDGMLVSSREIATSIW